MPLLEVFLLSVIKTYLNKIPSIPILLMRLIHNLTFTDLSLVSELSKAHIIEEMLIEFEKPSETLREFFVSEELISFFHSYIDKVIDVYDE